MIVVFYFSLVFLVFDQGFAEFYQMRAVRNREDQYRRYCSGVHDSFSKYAALHENMKNNFNNDTSKYLIVASKGGFGNNIGAVVCGQCGLQGCVFIKGRWFRHC